MSLRKDTVLTRAHAQRSTQPRLQAFQWMRTARKLLIFLGRMVSNCAGGATTVNISEFSSWAVWTVEIHKVSVVGSGAEAETETDDTALAHEKPRHAWMPDTAHKRSITGAAVKREV